MKYLLSLLFLMALSACALAAENNGDRTVVIDLPEYRVYFVLPKELTMPPWKAPDVIFDTTNPSFARDGARGVAEAFCDFKGPFWAGAQGTLRAAFFVNRPLGEYAGKIITLDELEAYLRWWTKDRHDLAFDRSLVNKSVWIRRSSSTFNQASVADREDLEIYSQPLDEGMFVNVTFQITEWIPGSAAKWKKKAENLREKIKDSIRIERK